MRVPVLVPAAALLALALGAAAQAVPAPDLTVRGLGLLPERPADGDAVTFNATLVNRGTAVASNARLAFLVDGTLYSTSPPVVLLPGMAINVSTPVPWTARAGAHDVRAVADPQGEVAETDETNNEASLAFEVGARPNLRVAALAVEPARPRAGEEVVVNATVENAGRGAAGAFHVRLTVDGAEVANASLPGLGPGERTRVVGRWNATAGAHLAAASADWLGEVDETDEGDNQRSAPFTVDPAAPQPDLVVADLRWTPPSPVHGDRVRLEALVRNAGQGLAPATVTRFVLDQRPLADAATPELRAGAEAWVEAPPWEAIAGSHQLRAEADAAQAVPEADEANNARAEPLPVAPAPGLPDLLVERLAFDPARPEEGQPVVVVARVRNGGAAQAGPFQVRFRVDGDAPGTVPVAGLAGGAFLDVRSPAWTAERGTHAVHVMADAAQQVAEADEGNNDATARLDVATPMPDLVVASLTVEPPDPSPGDDVVLVAEVRNQGNAPAGAFRVAFRVDGVALAEGELPVEGLAAGASRMLRSSPWEAQQGARLARALADSGGAVAESREDNNEATRPLPTLARMPNLVVERLGPSDDAPQEGQRLTLVAVVLNAGSAASGATDVRFTLDGRGLGASSLPGLAPGARATVHSPSFVAGSGLRTASAMADALQRVAELNEDDNARDAAFDVALGAGLAPSATGPLEVGPVRISPAAPRVGDDVEVRVELRNVGAEAAEGLRARLRVDGLPVHDLDVGSLGPGAATTLAFAWTATPGGHVLEVEVLRGGAVAAASPPRELTVAGAGGDGVGWFLPAVLLLALVAIGLAAWGVGRRGAAR